MSQHTPYMRLHGARMADAGFHILPIAASQKYPGTYSGGRWYPMDGWQQFAHIKPPEALIELWSNWPGAGVGIATGGNSGVIGVDIDLLDAELARSSRQTIERHLGTTPLARVGMAPKVVLLYRVSTPMLKLSYQPIEVLATGQQLVARGTHPDTGKPYSWESETPDETPVEQLPLVSPEQVKAAVEAAYALIPEEHKPKRLSKDSGTPHVSNRDEAPATIEAIREALQHIPNPDLSWDEWNRVLMATFAASNGSEAAWFEFLAWSRKSQKHVDNTARNKWTGCRRSPPTRMGFGTLHHLAVSHGWRPPAGLAFNVAKDTSNVDISGFDAMPIEQAPVLPSVPIAPRIQRNTVREALSAAPTTQRAELLKGVGLAEIENVDPSTGEVISLMYPTVDTGGQAPDTFIDSALSTILEDDAHLFRFEEPQTLALTQEEIDNGTLPRDFIDQFPTEWLFTNSLIGQVAQWVESSCAISHRVFALMASFTMFSSLVGRQYRTPSDLRPNLACCIIAGTGSGKEGPRSAITKLLLAAGAEKYIGPRGGFSSGSGVVEGLMNQPNMWLAVDEFGKKIAAYGGKADQNQREMIAMFLEALANDYLGGKGYANSKENAVKNVVYPNLNIFGSSQMEEITSALSSAAAADGLIQRFLFVPTFAEYVPIKYGFVKPPVPQNLIESLQWLIKDLEIAGGDFAMNNDATMSPTMRTVQITQQASDLFHQLDLRRVKMAQAGRVMWVRSAAMATKIAMLEAIARDPLEPVIDAEGLDSARRLVDWFTLYAETFVASKISDNDVERDLNKIRSIIADGAADGISRSNLFRKTQTMKSRDRDDHIKTLVESGQIVEQTEHTNGRPAKVFRLTGYAQAPTVANLATS